MGKSMIVLILILIGHNLEEYTKMVETQKAQGYTWEYVGEKPVTTEIAFPGEKYYWYLTPPK